MSKKPFQQKDKNKHHHHHQEKTVDVTKRSLLNVLRDNLKIAQRVAYVHRLIYIGDHSFNFSDEEDTIEEFFEHSVETVNSQYSEEKLTGFLLHYHKYFCVVIDGTEQGLVRHLRKLLLDDSKEESGPKLGRLKLLVAYHHINQRLLEEWTATSGRPPTLLEKLSPTADIIQTMDKVRYVIEKLYNLGCALRPRDKKEDGPELDDVRSTPSLATGRGYSSKTSGMLSTSKRAVGSIGYQSAFNLAPTQSKFFMQFLPEHSVLEFLLASQYTIELRNYPKVYGMVPYLDAYQDLVWPVECEFMPMNLQAVDIDPITDLDPEVIPK